VTVRLSGGKEKEGRPGESSTLFLREWDDSERVRLSEGENSQTLLCTVTEGETRVRLSVAG
jgi:hypothetical protein